MLKKRGRAISNILKLQAQRRLIMMLPLSERTSEYRCITKKEPCSLTSMSSFLYVLAANATTVNVLSVNTPGKATTVQNFNFAAAAKAAGIKFGKMSFVRGLVFLY